ncbi:MAG: RdgB/HAM1 family non-canonical purine NTP pyrophosphatase [Phycisphaerae bacterium]
MTATTTILIATGNSGKLREIQALMADLPVTFKTLADFPKLPPAVEDADTFAENAARKATHYSRLTGLWALADDSGLEVDALNGAPGIRSARYAGQPTNTAANNAKLIDALKDVPPELRSARFRCAVALADGDGILAQASGVLEGRIVDQPLGHNGFGFDPHFWVPELGMTTAQMPPEQKNKISHRGRALAALKPRIARLLPPA